MPSDNIHGISGTQFSFREDSQVFFTYIHGNCLKIFIYIVVIFQFYGFRLIKDIWQTSFKLIFFFFSFAKVTAIYTTLTPLHESAPLPQNRSFLK